MQLSKSTWEEYMLREHGWDWATVVLDPTAHYCAAYEIYLRAGETWGPWGCKP